MRRLQPWAVNLLPHPPCTDLELLEHGLLCSLQSLQLARVTPLLQVHPQGCQPVQQHSNSRDRHGSCCALEVLLVGEGAWGLLLDLLQGSKGRKGSRNLQTGCLAGMCWGSCEKGMSNGDETVTQSVVGDQGRLHLLTRSLGCAVLGHHKQKVFQMLRVSYRSELPLSAPLPGFTALCVAPGPCNNPDLCHCST